MRSVRLNAFLTSNYEILIRMRYQESNQIWQMHKTLVCQNN